MELSITKTFLTFDFSQVIPKKFTSHYSYEIMIKIRVKEPS